MPSGLQGDPSRRVPGRRGRAGLLVPLLAVIACDPGPEAVPVPATPWTPTPVTFPIAVDGDRLVDAAGRPFIVNGDTPWSLVVQLDSAEVIEYLDTRARQGVNAILFNLVDHRFADDAPRNAYGTAPFGSTLPDGEEDFRSLNDPYWDFVEWVVAQARARNMACFVLPAYVGYGFGVEGWAEALRANGPDRLAAYGDSVARRLAGFDNLVWVQGGDWGTRAEGFDLTDEVDALSASIEDALPQAILTAHSRRNLSALDSYGRPWLDLNTTYSDIRNGPVRLEQDFIRTDGVVGPRMPGVWIEGYYENEHDMSDTMVRAQMYWGLLGTTAGHFYGSHPVWSFGAETARDFGDSERPPYDSWESALVTEVAEDLIHARRLIDELPLADFRPDFGDDLLVSGRGEGRDWVAVARDPDRGRALLYTPRRKTLAVDLGALGGGSVGVEWISPRDGVQWDAGTVEGAGPIRLRPPARGDWVLLLTAGATR